MSSSPLFASFQIGSLTLRNRIAMAPMTREMAPGGVPTAAMAAYYARRAAGGVGLVISEGAPPCPAGAFSSAVPRFWGGEALAGWRRVVAAVHAEGAAFFPQLWHVGGFAPALIGMAESLLAGIERLSPSGLAAPGHPLGRAMTTGEIDATIEAFGRAAAAARAIGADGIEIHSAHGYLPDQFLWSGTNTRDDAWGASAAGRMRFAVELVRTVKAATAPDFPLSLRLSQWKQLDYAAQLAANPGELAALVEPLAAAGVDLFHCSTRRFWEPEFTGDPRNLAGWVRALSGRPTMTVGSVTLATDFKAPGGKVHAAPVAKHIAMLEAGLARGDFDLVAIGRALLANPDWVRTVAAGRAGDLAAFDRAVLETLD